MKRIFKFTKKQYGDKSIHNICREFFESQDNPVRAMVLLNDSGDRTYLVLADDSGKLRNLNTCGVAPTYNSGECVKVSVRVCYEYRREHSRGNVMSEEEAFDKFLSQTGLYPEEGSEILVKKLNCLNKFSDSQKEFHFKNCFEIKGEFEIQNSELFNKAILSGVGTRGSYGFGFILTEEILEQVA
jgi:hypothetical protein